MNLDIKIEVYEELPHGFGDSNIIDDDVSVSEETYQKVLEYHKQGTDDLECMKIPDIEKIVETLKEEHTGYALDRFLCQGCDEEDFEAPQINIYLSIEED